MKAPFPWFGGKSRAADLIWDRFGGVPNYVEPFAGSLAVLLSRPHDPGTETVNDLDCYLSNFWRALRIAPAQVAHHADWPVNEADLLARHRWLLNQEEFKNMMKTDPSYYDPKIAGWWVWGLCSWIGGGWCVAESKQLPHLGDAGRGILEYFEQLSDRLRKVRVACGSWERVLGDSVTVKHGVTGVLLDPPHDSERNQAYSAETNCSAAVRDWAVSNGDNPLYRIALCGYVGEHSMPDNWECIAWKAHGGYGSQGDGTGRDNSNKERIWFSPYCLKPTQQEVLDL